MADIWSSVPAPADSDTAEKVETTPIGKRDESEVQTVEETNPPPSSAVQTETKQKDQQETKAQTQEDATPSSAIEADQSPDVVKVPSATTATAGETETSSPASSAPTTPNSTKPKLNPSAQPFTAPKQPRGDRRTSSGRGSAPGSPAVSSAAGSKRGGSVSVGGSQRGGANMANSSPRMRAGYVPPEIVKPTKLSSEELAEKMEKMRLINEQTRQQAEAREADAAAYYASQAADRARAAEQVKAASEARQRRIDEQNRVNAMREQARKLKISQLESRKAAGVSSTGSGWGEKDEENVNQEKDE